MEAEFAKLMKTLHRREHTEWTEEEVEFLRRGPDAYRYLHQTVLDPQWTERQVVNALRLMFHLRGHTNPKAFVQKLAGFTSDERPRVRTAAVQILLTTVKVNEPLRKLGKVPTLDVPSIAEAVKTALALGLKDKGTTKHAQEFLTLFEKTSS